MYVTIEYTYQVLLKWTVREPTLKSRLGPLRTLGLLYSFLGLRSWKGVINLTPSSTATIHPHQQQKNIYLITYDIKYICSDRDKSFFLRKSHSKSVKTYPGHCIHILPPPHQQQGGAVPGSRLVCRSAVSAEQVKCVMFLSIGLSLINICWLKHGDTYHLMRASTTPHSLTLISFFKIPLLPHPNQIFFDFHFHFKTAPTNLEDLKRNPSVSRGYRPHNYLPVHSARNNPSAHSAGFAKKLGKCLIIASVNFLFTI